MPIENKMKARLVIPALLLVATMVYGAYASFAVLTISSTTTVTENISATETNEFTASLFPGEQATWTFTVSNANPSNAQSIDIVFTPDPDPLGQGVTYSVTVTGDGPNLDPCVTGASGQATCSPISVPASGTVTVEVTVSAAFDAAPGSIELEAQVFRV